MKMFFRFLFVAMAMALTFVLSACSPAQGLAQSVVVLPDPLQAAIGLGVLYLVGLALSGKLPAEYVMEIAAAITTALITIIGVLLRLIPLGFEPIANSILTLIVVLLGSLALVRALFVLVGKKHVAQKLRLLK